MRLAIVTVVLPLATSFVIIVYMVVAYPAYDLMCSESLCAFGCIALFVVMLVELAM